MLEGACCIFSREKGGRRHFLLTSKEGRRTLYLSREKKKRGVTHSAGGRAIEKSLRSMEKKTTCSRRGDLKKGGEKFAHP